MDSGHAACQTGAVGEVARAAERTADGLRRTLGRLAALTLVAAVFAAVVGVATFATGCWVFEGRVGWFIIGGVICSVPALAALTGWILLRVTASVAPRLLDDVRTYLASGSKGASGVLIDHDAGIALGMQARSLRAVRADLDARRRDLPALWAGVRAITMVPGLAAIAVLGTVFVGALGFLVLIGGLID